MARSQEDVRRGLCAVIYAGENFTQASRDLAADGLKISKATLSEWVKKTHAAEYQRIKAEEGPKLREQAAEQHLSASRRLVNVGMQMTSRLEAEVGEIPARDLPGGIRNAMTGAGIAVDKAQLLKGEPTQILQRSADDILRSIGDKLGRTFVEGEATEEPIEQLPPGSEQGKP